MQEMFNVNKFPLISVIIPVYKVEKYLVRCVRSVINQTYDNLEIILVDDGSPDGCGRICDEFSAKDDRIKVVHKANGGLSDARNVGIDAATGDLIGFVDSDDYIKPEMFEVLYKRLYENSADISVCGIVKRFEDGSEKPENAFTESVCLDGDVALEILLEDDKIPSYFCNKLFKSELFKELRFPVGVIYEDLAFSFYVFYRAKKVVCVNYNLYYYCLRKDSTCAVMGAKQIYGLFNAFSKRYEFACSINVKREISDICLAKACVFAVKGITSILGGEQEYDKYIADIRAFLKKYRREIADNVGIEKKRKTKIFLINNFYHVFRLLYGKELKNGKV